MNIFVVVIGYLAGFCAVISFIPQAIKTIKTRNTKEISLKTYIIYIIANFLFLLFGILSIALPIMHPSNTSNTQIIIWGITLILPYSVTIIAVTSIIVIKLQNMRKFKEKSNNIIIPLQQNTPDMEVNNNVI